MLEFTLNGCDMSHALYYHPRGDEWGDQVAMNNCQDATINHCILWCNNAQNHVAAGPVAAVVDGGKNAIQGESTVLTVSSEMQGVSTHIAEAVPAPDIPAECFG